MSTFKRWLLDNYLVYGAINPIGDIAKDVTKDNLYCFHYFDL
jgi:hypothetical protein